jgi:hypothetical protein
VLHDLEQEVLGVTHAEVGAYLLSLWGLPSSLVEATALHHAPSQTPDFVLAPLTAVHAANVLEKEGENSELKGPQSPLDFIYFDRLGLASHVPVWREKLGLTPPLAAELSARAVGV